MIDATLSNAEFKKHFEQDGVEIIGGTLEQFDKRVRAYLLWCGPVGVRFQRTDGPDATLIDLTPFARLHAQICPINWTQDGTEMLLGQRCCQGGVGSNTSA